MLQPHKVGCAGVALESMYEHGPQVLPFKIMRFGIQRGQLLWRSQFFWDLIKTRQTCAKNSFPLKVLLLIPLSICLRRFSTI